MSRQRLLRIGALVLMITTLMAPTLVTKAQAGLTAAIAVDTANVRTGPGTNFSVLGQLPRGAVVSLSGRNAADSWWYGCCVNGKNGWISRTVATPSGNTATLPIIDTASPTPKPPAQQPTPAPATYPDWKGEYFNDIYLAPPPLMVRNDPRIDFAWNLDAPDPRVPADNFSVRWTRSVNFAAGSYVFQARTSDGVRIYLDTMLVLNEWHDTEGYPTYVGRFFDLGAGWHTVTVEYYERGGIAYATVWWDKYTGAQ
jgi:hypothetical protein